jgi:ribosomal protein L29
MQFKEFKELPSIDEKGLQNELQAAKKFLNALQFENSQGNLKDTSQIRKTRVYIARINTIQSSRVLESQKA